MEEVDLVLITEDDVGIVGFDISAAASASNMVSRARLELELAILNDAGKDKL